MKNLKELFEAEFKNLYVLEKQILEKLPEVNKGVESEKLKKIVDRINKKSENQFNKLHKWLQDSNINPGNTVDSVAQEIIENLVQISKMDIDQDVKEAGLYASLLRLSYYKKGCYRATRKLAKVNKLDKIQGKINSILDKNDQDRKKLNRWAKKEI